MPRKLNPRYREIWRHNSFSGHAAMMKAQCENIVTADTTNVTAKKIAREIYRLAGELQLALKERVDS